VLRNSPSTPGQKWQTQISPSFEHANSKFPFIPHVKSLTPERKACLMIKNAFSSPVFHIQMFESPPDVAKYEEQASFPLTISFLSIGLNLAIFTDFS